MGDRPYVQLINILFTPSWEQKFWILNKNLLLHYRINGTDIRTDTGGWKDNNANINLIILFIKETHISQVCMHVQLTNPSIGSTTKEILKALFVLPHRIAFSSPILVYS